MADETSEIKNRLKKSLCYSCLVTKLVKLDFKWHRMPIIHQKSWFDDTKNFSPFLPIFGPQSPYFLFHKVGNPANVRTTYIEILVVSGASLHRRDERGRLACDVVDSDNDCSRLVRQLMGG
jgi:hypothetical protein